LKLTREKLLPVNRVLWLFVIFMPDFVDLIAKSADNA